MINLKESLISLTDEEIRNLMIKWSFEGGLKNKSRIKIAKEELNKRFFESKNLLK